MEFNVFNCYWIVGGDITQLWSSDQMMAVSLSDPTYTSWRAAGNQPRAISSYSDLYNTLLVRAPMIAATVAPTWLAGGLLAPDQALAFRISLGLTIISTGTPSLNAVYDITPDSQLKISGIITGINADRGIPGGGSTFAWQDVGSVPHGFTADQFIDFAAAVESYMYSLYITEAVLLNGGSVDWPSSTVTIP